MNALAQRLSQRTPDHTAALVTAVVVVLAGFGLLFDWGEGTSEITAVTAIVTIVAAGLVWFRHRSPLVVLLVVGAAHVLLTWDTGNEVALIPALLVALFTMARLGNRRVGLTTAAVIGLVLAASSGVLDSDPFLPEFLGASAIMAVPIAIGDASRSRADRIRDMIDTEATSRVQAERLRIARDLHDVVAHGLSTIAIQSGVAAHLIDKDPNMAKEALEVINATGKSSLEELRAMVGVLRSTDDAPLRPTPSDPNDLTDLLAAAGNAGIDITVEATGSFPMHVSDSCVVAMHRIIQEALTNVARHAGGAATTLGIDHAGDRVTIEIANAAGTAPNLGLGSTGVGIIGMQERAESLGGTLTTAPLPGGGFHVTAVLPYELTRKDRP